MQGLRSVNATSGRAAPRRAATWTIGLLIATACVLSLIWSISATAADPKAAYFSTPARVWELGCGAALALLATPTRLLPIILRQLLGWVGLGMIFAAALLYSGSTSFPGYTALLPVIGSGLIIVAGMTPTPVGVDRVLAARPLPYIGDRSYTFYLWHYPALILVWQLAGRELPVSSNLIILTGAFMLSMFTYKFYENPLRYARWLRGWRTVALVPAALSASAVAIAVPIALFEHSSAKQASASTHAVISALTPAPSEPAPTNLWHSTPIPAVAAAASSAKRNAPLPKTMVPSMKDLAGRAFLPPGCVPTFGSGVTSKICRLGDTSSSRVVVVFGDSQAGTWMPAMVAVARAQHFAVVPLDKSGCFVNNRKGACGSWYRWALGRDKALHPVATIVNFWLTARMQEHLATSTVSYMKSVLLHVSNGVLLANQPSQAHEPSACLYRSGATMGKCSTHVPSAYVPLMKAMGRMASLIHRPVIPTLQWFCANGICPMVINNTVTVKDLDHMTKQYSDELAPLLELELKQIIARRQR